ncbi:hypothetical protein K445DRAFT_13461 [Daldinia sp. EC12]|nr:hypothetical protein K445DRAFT_13461 [Daldinia sp. EC12]
MADTNNKRAGSFTAELYDEPSKRRRPEPPSIDQEPLQEPLQEPPTGNYFTRSSFHTDAPYYGLYPDPLHPESPRLRDSTNAHFTRHIDHLEYFPIPEEPSNPQRQHYRRVERSFHPFPASRTSHQPRSSTIPPRQDEPTPGLQTSFDTERVQEDLDSLFTRVEELEALVEALNRSYKDIKLPRVSAINNLRREIDNLSMLEGQTNNLEARMHDMSCTIRDLQASVDATNAFIKSKESKVGRSPAAQAQAKERNPDKVSKGDNEDSDSEVVFLGELRIQGGATNTNENDDNYDHYQPDVITRAKFIAYLKSLDFRVPYGMEAFANTPVRARDYSLCTLKDGTVYFVRLGASENGWWNVENEPYERKPLMLPRCKRGHLDGDQHLDSTRPSSLLHYRSNVCEIEYPDSNFVFAPSLRYALPLGEIHVYKPRVDRVPSKSFSTNFFLFMDITSPQKSLWIVYAYEYTINKNGGDGPDSSDGTVGIGKYELDRNSPLCAGFGLFDVACIADSLDDFVDSTKGSMPAGNNPRGHQKITLFPQLDPNKVLQMLRSTACIAQPVLTEPNLGSLSQAISQGWSK